VKESTGWALVGTQFGLLAALLVLPPGDLWPRGLVSGIIAGVLILAGIALALAAGIRMGRALTPLPTPRADGHLVTTGVFRYLRHPIYSGLLLAAAGLVAWGASWVHVIGFVLLWAVLNTKAFFEEKMLLEHYPDYADYRSRTGRLLPRVW